MSGDYKPEVGHRVRVVIEGEVQALGLNWATVKIVDGVNAEIHLPTSLCVERIPEPVEVFGPGDTVQHKDGSYYFIGLDGFFCSQTNEWNDWVTADELHMFTSEHYRKVKLIPAGDA